jgi:hypothetical protein
MFLDGKIIYIWKMEVIHAKNKICTLVFISSNYTPLKLQGFMSRSETTQPGRMTAAARL